MENTCAPPRSADAPARIADARGLDHARTRLPGPPTRPGDTRGALAPTRERPARSAIGTTGRLTLDGAAEHVCGKLAAFAEPVGSEAVLRPLGFDPVREPAAFAAVVPPS
ncbi:hypothetical protein [Embleya sp. NPDC005971]|uniref:hypothetical protein n=1 Tax=Embleya sp. NPDC005971 TaxID=3156724 RepID=UPI0033F6D42D